MGSDQNLVSLSVTLMLDRRIRAILLQRKSLEKYTDQGLLDEAKRLKGIAQSGRGLNSILVRFFALSSECTRRVLGKLHYPVQLHAGIQMMKGRIAEMQTGEGKTITAIPPAALRALVGLGCHVLTANEYLATRDAEQLKAIYEMLGLSLGCVTTDMDDANREEAYRKDVTYTTAAEIGFDFLRDQMKLGLRSGSRAVRPVLRGFYFALVDEADSILIDDARTPLVIGSEKSDGVDREKLCRWACDLAAKLEPNKDFLLDPKRRSADLSEYGCRTVLLSKRPEAISTFNNEEVFQHVERAIVARYHYLRERDYIVMEDQSVVIVDEGSGRVMEERKWQQGLHQAIEAKEAVPITPGNSTAAQITLQTLFRKYDHLAGMTGTAFSARGELSKIYKLGTRIVPTHRPCIRQEFPTRVFIDLKSKIAAVALDVQGRVSQGRAVLIGTPSVEASEQLSGALSRSSIPHQVLNCRSHGKEAEIIANAGLQGTVTIATNMAGRGTDILLDEAVRSSGGLHVIATERHSSARIDRQLVGRCARQGDPGSFQFFLSFEDELFRSVKSDYHQRLIAYYSKRTNSAGELPRKTEKIFLAIQRSIERQHVRSRFQLLRQEKDRLKKLNEMSINPFIELLND